MEDIISLGFYHFDGCLYCIFCCYYVASVCRLFYSCVLSHYHLYDRWWLTTSNLDICITVVPKPKCYSKGWCLSSSAPVKFRLLAEEPQLFRLHLSIICTCWYAAENKEQIALAQQPLLFPKVRHEELTFIHQSQTSLLERSGFSITQSKGAALPAQLTHMNRAQAQNHTQIPWPVKVLCGKHKAGFRSYRLRDIN